jgi:predicted O-methyltransferase YrrM
MMTGRTIPVTDALYDYLVDVSVREPALLRRLREETASHPHANMQISPDQGQFLAWLIRLTGAKQVIEVGVFTGYSSLCMALAMPADGRLIALDKSEEYTRTARAYWQEAGVAARVELRLGPALDSLDRMLADGGRGTFDFAFIDALKTEYIGYYERTLQLLRAGGVMAIDNVLWEGRLVDPADQDPLTVAIREFNAHLTRDERVDISLLTVADGVTLVRKR